MTAHHRLKTYPVWFQRVWEGSKTFEVRLNDRGFQSGDRVTLREWDRRVECACSTTDHDEDCEKFCGREITARVGFVMANLPGRGAVRAFNAGDYVVFALLDVEKHGKPKPSASPSPASVFGGAR